jgi:hypothetical protein
MEQAMRTLFFSTATLAVSLSIWACGSDKGGPGASSAAGSAATTGGAGSAGKLVCAKVTCALPAGMTGELCCADQFSGGCGIKSNSSCLVFPKADPRCPAPDFSNFMLPPGVSPPDGGTMGFFTACCGANNLCGVDYGMGCMSISSLCAILPKYLTSTIRPASCDGTPMELPPNCGTDNNIMIPGVAGSKG